MSLTAAVKVALCFLQQDQSAVLQLSTARFAATQEILLDSLLCVLMLAPEFLWSARFLKRSRGVPSERKSTPLDPRGFRFHLCSVHATFVPIYLDFSRNLQDSRHPRSRAERMFGTNWSSDQQD